MLIQWIKMMWSEWVSERAEGAAPCDAVLTYWQFWSLVVWHIPHDTASFLRWRRSVTLDNERTKKNPKRFHTVKAILNCWILIWAKWQALVVTGWICVHPILPLLQTLEMSALLKWKKRKKKAHVWARSNHSEASAHGSSLRAAETQRLLLQASQVNSQRPLKAM